MKQLAIPLKELLAIPLSNQKTVAKWLVISAMKHALSGWLCGSGLLAAIKPIAARRPLPPNRHFKLEMELAYTASRTLNPSLNGD